jgi:tRNA-splicing ligase RtcB
MNFINNIPVFGDPMENALEQMTNCMGNAKYGALMADHHLGYSLPIGGVIAWEGFISPSSVGYDIACGNKAVRLDVNASEVRTNIGKIMDDIFSQISFGVGRKNKEDVDHELFYSDRWDVINDFNKDLKELARSQLGTVGSGNHYVDLFVDELDRVWCGVHFGSRGLGHKTATHFLKEGGGKDGINELPTLLNTSDTIGQDYIRAMQLAGDYAYAGRDWVCQKVANILGSNIVEEIHNHHNFAWEEEHFGQKIWVARKGATPAFPDQLGFVGGSMGENSVILKGVEAENSKHALYSTVHGAGRVLSRTQAAGRKKWKRVEEGKPKRLVCVKEGSISKDMMMEWVDGAGVELRGAGTDESPHCYKRLNEVLEAQGDTIEVIHTLKPIGVAMAGDEFDPYKD